MKKTNLALVLLGTLVLASCGQENSVSEVIDHSFIDVADVPTREATVIMPDGTRQVVTGQVKNGNLFVEGDILLADSKSLSSQGTILTSLGRRWPNRTLPYAFQPNVPAEIRNRVAQAAQILSNQTNVTVKPRTNEKNYVLFSYNTNGDCYSSAGMVGGAQELALSGRCQVGSVVHEINHALGMLHEQSRPDRDKYITILWEKIPSDWKGQYAILPGTEGNGPYDYDSIMHYPPYFNYPDNIVMVPKDPSVDVKRIGQRTRLTPGDIAAINAMYPLSGSEKPTPTPVNPAPKPVPNPVPAQGQYTGTATKGQTVYQPEKGFQFAGGTLKAVMTGPANSDFDLYLQSYDGRTWQTVARSQNTNSNESISRTLQSGTYRWAVRAYYGSGSFQIKETR